jgi:hypothetical protein
MTIVNKYQQVFRLCCDNTNYGVMKNQKLHVMKRQILLMCLIISFLPLTLSGQKKYYNLDFEKSDTTGSKVFKLKNEYEGTLVSIDSTKSVSGKTSLNINAFHTNQALCSLITFILPKQYYKDLRTIDISINIYAQNSAPNLECVASKGKETIGCNMTCNDSTSWFTAEGQVGRQGYYRPGVCLIHEFKPAPKLDIWTTHSFNITIDRDPTEVKFYMIISSGITWFDNLVIKLNGSPIRLVFEL